MKELITIQHELKSPKSQHNKFGDFNYRSAEDILEAVKPLLASNGCILTLSDEIVQIGERYYVKATARITKDSESMETVAYAREEESKKGMDRAQVTGTASSYARKYALNGLFCIDDTKDADTDEYTARTTKTSGTGVKKTEKKSAEELAKLVNNKEANITPGAVSYLSGLAEETKSDITELFKFYDIERFEDMTVKQYEHCCNILEKRLKEKIS